MKVMTESTNAIPPAPLGIGSRVIVMLTSCGCKKIKTSWPGEIVGVTRSGTGWRVKRDAYSTVASFHKSLCRPAPVDGILNETGCTT